MLTISQILEKTGLTLHCFQSWRRNDSNLLPRPVAVDKRSILFDDSILTRIQLIRDCQAEGLTLAQIREYLNEELNRDMPDLPTYEDLVADGEEILEANRALKKKWSQPKTCWKEICKTLNLDPTLSGQPTVFTRPRPPQDDDFPPFQIFTSLIFSGEVHFAELQVDFHGEPHLVQRRAMPVQDYLALLYVLGREYADRKLILKPEMIPCLIFHGLEGTGTAPAYWAKFLEMATALRPVFEGGLGFLNSLREKAGEAIENQKPHQPRRRSRRKASR